ncbi:MAG: hypothetical protein ACI8PZ_000293 [Myxococcota bacterium]|jgi:hypothetical protein
MAWPDWLETLKTRYLEDEASIFVLHGAVVGATWTVDGEALEAGPLLARFLQRTRPIVGTMAPDGRLDFPTMGEAARFERMVSAAEVILGRTIPASGGDPLSTLARIWLALGTSGVDQGWIVSGVERLLPAHRARIDPLPKDVPPLFDWPRHPRVRRSNNVLVFLVPNIGSVRAELLDAASPIAVRRAQPPKRPAPAPEPTPSPEAPPIGDPTPAAPPAESPSAQPPSATVSPPAMGIESVGDLLHETVDAAVRAHPRETWGTGMPVMDAVARVLHRAAPHRFGALAFELDEEGSVQARGDGADDFMAMWRSDIALDASAGMLVKKLLEAEPSAELTLDSTGMTALTRRVTKLLARVAPREL